MRTARKLRMMAEIIEKYELTVSYGSFGQAENMTNMLFDVYGEFKKVAESEKLTVTIEKLSGIERLSDVNSLKYLYTAKYSGEHGDVVLNYYAKELEQ